MEQFKQLNIRSNAKEFLLYLKDIKDKPGILVEIEECIIEELKKIVLDEEVIYKLIYRARLFIE